MYKQYFNIPSDKEYFVPKGQEKLTKIQTIYTKNPEICLNQKILVNIENFSMIINGITYPISIGDLNFKGVFKVIEKIKYPFFRGERYFHYPSKKNFLGKYLIILSDKNGNKISQGIHSYLKSMGNFYQGFKKGNGCIRLSPNFEDKIFEEIKLGAKIIIK